MTPDTSAHTVADMFLKHLFGHFDALARILSDNGGPISELMADVIARLSVRQVFTAPYHPQSNGVVERLNGTFTSMVKKYMNEDQTVWVPLLLGRRITVSMKQGKLLLIVLFLALSPSFYLKVFDMGCSYEKNS